MKQLLLLFFVLFSLFSCQENAFIPKPKKKISPDKMSEILVDYYLSQAYSNDAKKEKGKGKGKRKAINPSAFIYKKYQIDSLQFISNMNYYLSQEDVILTIFENADKQLQEKKAFYENKKHVNDSLKKVKNTKKKKLLHEKLQLEKKKYTEVPKQ